VNKFELVLFDLDGTLIDTDKLIFMSYRHVFNKYRPDYKLTFEEVINFLGPTLMDTFKVYFPNENHDEMIAYTSQLCHVVSNAFVKSPVAQKHHGYSAGSFRDLTRVARLNENMWTELFLDNKKPLLGELDRIINSLQQYREAIENDDAQTLCSLLREGRIAKEQSEG
jgi:prephenate dehydrogenase